MKQRLVSGSRLSSIRSFRDSAWLTAWPLHRNDHGCKQAQLAKTWRPVHNLLSNYFAPWHLRNVHEHSSVVCDSIKFYIALVSQENVFAKCTLDWFQATFIFTASDGSINWPLILWISLLKQQKAKTTVQLWRKKNICTVFWEVFAFTVTQDKKHLYVLCLGFFVWNLKMVHFVSFFWFIPRLHF